MPKYFGLKNALDTITSKLQTSATSVRTWTLQNRDGVLADDTDIAQLLIQIQQALDALVDKADLVSGIVPTNQLPSYVDEVIEHDDFAALPQPGVASKLYITLDNNHQWRWGGSVYIDITGTSLALGETSSTAYRGDRGATAYTHSQIATGNPHGTVASDLSAYTSAQVDTLLAAKADTTAAVGVQDLFIPASAMWPRQTAGCSQLTKTEVATSLFNIQTLDFDQTTQEFAQFQMVLPRKWNNSTITAKVYWTAAAGSGGVVWGLSSGAYRNDDALTTILGTPVTIADTLIATNDLHISDATAAMTVAGTLQDENFLAFSISRNPADGSDTIASDVKLLGVSFRITTDAARDA